MTDKNQSKSDVTQSINPRGIPAAPFVDKIEDYVASGEHVEGTLKSFQEMISKYQFMELNTQRRVASLKEKLPEMQKSLDTVRFLSSQDESSPPLKATFSLSDTLFAHANVPPTSEVYLWLGANIMLSYPIPEAEELLQSKLQAAKKTLETCEEDLDYLREQITTLEVATARVYNWDVTRKRKERETKEVEEKKGGAKGREKGDEES